MAFVRQPFSPILFSQVLLHPNKHERIKQSLLY